MTNYIPLPPKTAYDSHAINAKEILSLPVGKNEFGAKTIGQLLAASNFQYFDTASRETIKSAVAVALKEASEIDIVTDRDGNLYSIISTNRYENIIKAIKEHLTKADYSTLELPKPVREHYFVDFGSIDMDGKPKMSRVISGPYTFDEAREAREKFVGVSKEYDRYRIVKITSPDAEENN